jgi:hypothetical protein
MTRIIGTIVFGIGLFTAFVIALTNSIFFPAYFGSAFCMLYGRHLLGGGKL